MAAEEKALLALRLAAQGLSRPDARTPEEAVGHLLAVQAQDPRGARLAVRVRTTGVAAADVDAAFDGRRLVITWLNRGTLHLVRAEDYWWLHPLTTPQLATGVAGRLRQEGVSPAQAERGREVIAEQVATLGPRTRAELREALGAAGVPTGGQALVQLLAWTSLRGDLVRGPMRGAEQCFVGAEAWLGPRPEPLERPAALAQLARRYLAGHAPAEERDLAKWAGITLGDARLGLAGVVEETVRRPAPPLPPPRLLGSYDPLLHGWVSRELVVGAHEGIVTSNGLFRPFALVDGRAVATWGLAAGVVTIHPLERIRRRDLDALEADAAGVLRFLGLPDRPSVVEP